MTAAIECVDGAARAGIERRAAKLSVRLLMPTGLCFLPAFICVGVIPLGGVVPLTRHCGAASVERATRFILMMADVGAAVIPMGRAW